MFGVVGLWVKEVLLFHSRMLAGAALYFAGQDDGQLRCLVLGNLLVKRVLLLHACRPKAYNDIQIENQLKMGLQN